MILAIAKVLLSLLLSLLIVIAITAISSCIFGIYVWGIAYPQYGAPLLIFIIMSGGWALHHYLFQVLDKNNNAKS